MNTILNKVEVFATNFITNEIPESLIYHDISYTHRLVSGVKEIYDHEEITDKEKELLLIAAWIFGTGFFDAESSNGKNMHTGCMMCTQRMSAEFLYSVLPKEDVTSVFQILENTKHESQPQTTLDFIFLDALFMDFARKKGMKYVKKKYQELLIFNALKISKKKGITNLISMLEAHTYFTNYGKSSLEPKKHQLIKLLKKEVKAFESIENSALKKELDISDKELKNLKKNLGKSNDVDIRTIQTLFRNTSKNHYTLNTMVDRKASIMLSINAIIISLLVSGIVGQTAFYIGIHLIPVFILLISSAVSIIFAVLAINPNKTHGEFTEDAIRNKKGNLLYFGNFHNMNYRDYEWAMLEMISDKDYLYSSLIRDIYYLGEKIHKKHHNIRVSLNTFLYGTGISVIGFIMVKLITHLA